MSCLRGFKKSDRPVDLGIDGAILRGVWLVSETKYRIETMTTAQKVYRELRKSVSKNDARYATPKLILIYDKILNKTT